MEIQPQEWISMISYKLINSINQFIGLFFFPWAQWNLKAMTFPNSVLEDRLSSHYPFFKISSHKKLLKGKDESVSTVWRVLTRRIVLNLQ